ncbi:response regulator transcription factor [Colwellia sp. 4_MG-2023]|uniref:response regulator transcription factor n=1 Tax=unclassified Colwellia TaxID=196834 RepID=UPI001C0A04C1|nr:MULTISPECIES: response regulator transcription factor [unclassified Colwellia]MBU2923713.1 response regulator transcription factor [Colwellia sp. C2M11]MDO6486299.1 response regulator transcription factor [Colwellia sp. 6_MG-2023]MDO6505764.1 response regulator transcription factor [Colwellia sp. 5_MG-2023]MDO6554445.1 response regulator transcription factor [Colwellia sp. 4_MG-2023]MDO6652187.1 response regulator transcription factor [Colwellia sp. 3_MG-2023]
MIKILVVEDQALVRGAICSLLALEDNIEIVGQAENGQIALDMLKNIKVDFILSDIEMPIMSGLELAERVQADYTHIDILIMTTFSKSGYIKRAMALGVKAFILKESPTEYLVNAIKQVQNGQRVIDPELALMALDDNDPLSNKERKAIKLAGDGLKTAEIAQALFLSEGTVRNYLSEAISKLNAVNRIDAARIAKQKGWI